MIADSGNRTKFSTGAVRDCKDGVGRMDLLPMTAIIELSEHCEEGAKKYGEHNVDKGIPQHSLCDSGMRHLVKYMRGDTDEDHLRAACWNLMWALEQRERRPDMMDLYRHESKEKRHCSNCMNEYVCNWEPEKYKGYCKNWKPDKR
ncbi:MAG: dATP/dGTP diphosphohydrolase domain-containing protein [Bariatricus sp.]